MISNGFESWNFYILVGPIHNLKTIILTYKYKMSYLLTTLNLRPNQNSKLQYMTKILLCYNLRAYA